MFEKCLILKLFYGKIKIVFKKRGGNLKHSFKENYMKFFKDIKVFFKNLFGNDEPENTGNRYTDDEVLNQILLESYKYLGQLAIECIGGSEIGKGKESGKKGITKNVRPKAVEFRKQPQYEKQIKKGLNHEQRE